MSLFPVATTSRQVPTMFVDHQTLYDVEACIIHFTKAAQLIRNAKKSSNSHILTIISSLLKKTLKRSWEVVSKHLKVGSVQTPKDIDPLCENFRIIIKHRSSGTGFIENSRGVKILLLPRNTIFRAASQNYHISHHKRRISVCYVTFVIDRQFDGLSLL